MEKKAAESVMRRGLIQEDLLKSPYLQPQLSEMDSNLNFTSSNLFDITVVPVDNKFSFMPIRGMQSHDEMMLNNDSFARAVVVGNGLPSFDTGCYAVQRVQSHESTIYRPSPHSLVLFDGKVPATAPSYPPRATKVGTTTKSSDLLMKLKGMEEELLCEVRGSKNAPEQLQKLELIQNWAKSIAMRPLQPRGEPTFQAQVALSEAAASTATTGIFPMIVRRANPTDAGQLTNKKESSGTPGTPSITP